MPLYFLTLLVSQSKESGELRGEGEAQGKGYKVGCSALGIYELLEPVAYSIDRFFFSQLHWEVGSMILCKLLMGVFCPGWLSPRFSAFPSSSRLVRNFTLR